MSNAFIDVKLADWDCSKVSIGIAPGGKTPTVLYAGKMPILTLAGDGRDDKYVVSSFKGIQKNMKWDAASKKFLDTWEGDWSISFKVCDAPSTATGLRKKILEIFADIEKKAEEAYEKKCTPVIQKKKIKGRTAAGVEKVIGYDENSPAYLTVKIGYEAPPGSETFTDPKSGRSEPVFEARTPKAKFYDVKRARDEMLVRTAATECQTAMMAIPKFMVGLYNIEGGGLHVTKKLFQCYYEPTTIGGGGVDDALIDMLRAQDIDLSPM